MIKKIEHVGIAVKDLNQSNALFEKLLGEGSYKTETVEAEGVKTSFLNLEIKKLSFYRLRRAIALFQNFLTKEEKECTT